MNQCRRPIGDQFMFSLSPTRALMSTIAMGAGFQFAWLFIVTANEMLPAEGKVFIRFSVPCMLSYLTFSDHKFLNN